jgi:hypothetical protein
VQKLNDLLPHERGPRVEPVRGPADLRVSQAPCVVAERFSVFFWKSRTERVSKKAFQVSCFSFSYLEIKSILTFLEAPVVVEHGETVGDEQGRL